MPVLELNKRDKNNHVRKVGSIEIRNQTEDAADLCFFGDINSESMGEWQKYYPEDKAPSDVKDFLDQLENVSKINVHINSGGGSVFGGIAIYNLLSRHDAEITVYVEGLAASIASVIAMAGDEIIIPANAQMMIHKPSSYAWGDADEMRKQADVLDGCQKVILSTYMRHAKEGVTEDQLNDLINAETWKNGEEWQEYFDIEVSETNTAAAAASEYFEKYANMPDALKKQPDQDESMKSTEEVADVIAGKIIDAMSATLHKQTEQTGQQKEAEETRIDASRQAEEILKDLDFI